MCAVFALHAYRRSEVFFLLSIEAIISRLFSCCGFEVRLLVGFRASHVVLQEGADGAVSNLINPASASSQTTRFPFTYRVSNTVIIAPVFFITLVPVPRSHSICSRSSCRLRAVSLLPSRG
jgi:hypothetical protein